MTWSVDIARHSNIWNTCLHQLCQVFSKKNEKKIDWSSCVKLYQKGNYENFYRCRCQLIQCSFGRKSSFIKQEDLLNWKHDSDPHCKMSVQKLNYGGKVILKNMIDFDQTLNSIEILNISLNYFTGNHRYLNFYWSRKH